MSLCADFDSITATMPSLAFIPRTQGGFGGSWAISYTEPNKALLGYVFAAGVGHRPARRPSRPRRRPSACIRLRAGTHTAMRRSLAILLVSLTAVLGASARVDPATAAGDGGPAPRAETTAASSLSLSADRDTIVFGERVVVRGRLTVSGEAAMTSMTVIVSARTADGGAPVVVGTLTPAPDGRFSLLHTPSFSTTYVAEVSAAGAAAVAPAEVTVGVRSRVMFTVPRVMWIGAPAAFRGTVRPRRPAGTTVTIQRRLGGRWRTVATAPTDASSRFFVRWTPRGRGRPVFRARVAADALTLAGFSRKRSGRSRDPNPHRVPLTYRRLIVIDHRAYRLYYYERGRIVRDFPCVLGKPTTPTPLGKGFRVRRKRMQPGGANGARYMGYLGVIGIHGTDQPRLLRRFPRAFSNGCTRLYDHNVIWLYDRVPVGTRVWNVRGPRR